MTPPDTLRTRNPAESSNLYRTVIRAVTQQPVHADTLWIKTKDYAAHCLITPSLVDAGKYRYLRGFVSPFGDTLYTVNVPRDYDGYQDPSIFGWNYGDYMADAWESKYVDSTAIPNFQPFIIPTTGALADSDYKPTGRGFEGDYLTNFEEYRGFMVANDSTNTSAGHHFVRTNPINKTVFVHVRPNVEDSTTAAMPGYIYAMPDAEIYLTDFLKIDSVGESRRRTYSFRDINFNKAGSGLWYPGYGLPTTLPVPDTSKANAITFWRWAGSLDETDPPPGIGPQLLGFTKQPIWPGSNAGDGGTIPRFNSRCVVIDTHLVDLRNGAYYTSHPNTWFQDYLALRKQVIAHECGHAFGMLHTMPSDTGIMSRPYVNNFGPDSGRVHIPPGLYNQSSQDSFSIKAR